MKIKQLPQDFIVEEILNYTLVAEGDYKIYRLKKIGLETFSLIKQISYQNRIQLKDIGYCGIKDRHAITIQYISIPKTSTIKYLRGDNYELQYLGYIKEPLKTGDLEENKFTIVVRDLEENEITTFEEMFPYVSKNGFINYFDSQRFGSFDKETGSFVARAVVAQDYELAVKLFFKTQYSEKAKGNFYKLLSELLKDWNKFGKLKLDIDYVMSLQAEYRETQSWKSTYQVIPVKLREIFLMAYQSYLWNEAVKLLLEKQKCEFETVSNTVGEVYFLTTPTTDLPQTFPLVGRKFEPTELEKEITDVLLARENITYDQIKEVSKSGSFLKSYPRAITILPKNFEVSQYAKDEYAMQKGKKRQKVQLTFTLPKGVYATCLVKALFLE